MSGKWINIFRTGTHTDSSGRTRTWTEGDLDRIVGNFTQRTEDPPVVFGHPKDSDPAQGWFTAVRRSGEFLQAQFARFTDKARQGVKNKAWKYVSLSLTPDLRIRHLGLLGAVPPAVKGLGEIEFQEDEGMTVFFNFNESAPENVPGDPKPEEPSMTEEELKAQLKATKEEAAKEKAAREKAEADLKANQDAAKEKEAERRSADHTARVDKLIEDGKLLPAHKDKVLAFCEAMDGENGGEEMSFSEGEGKKPLVDHFLSFMAENKGHGLLHEFSAPSGPDEAVTEDLTQYV
ncbi:phage protease [Pseudodesulfovibrio methanolicus]|uniref:Phage protease n=1 Tax=Pseudodesulfovibrio methanolicus TaxID=3126690 RepID=A0ABZ2IZE3_9BACT